MTDTNKDYSSDLDEIVLKPATWQYDDYQKAKAKLSALLRRVEAIQGASEKPQSGNKPSGKQVVTLSDNFQERLQRHRLIRQINTPYSAGNTNMPQQYVDGYNQGLSNAGDILKVLLGLQGHVMTEGAATTKADIKVTDLELKDE